MYNPHQRLLRSRTDKVIAGVAGGIGQYLAIDPVLVRLAFVALCFTGVGILLYPILWVIMPVEGSAGSTAHQAFDEMRQQANRVGDEIRTVFVSHDSTSRQPRFDPMTGQPLNPEGENEIPINNVNSGSSTQDQRDRRNQFLGIALLVVGGLFLLNMIPGLGIVMARILFPALLIGAGVYLIRRNQS